MRGAAPVVQRLAYATPIVITVRRRWRRIDSATDGDGKRRRLRHSGGMCPSITRPRYRPARAALRLRAPTDRNEIRRIM